MVEHMKTVLETFPGHSFRAKWQTDQLKKLVENLPENECVTVHDFSENYRCTERIEIQSSYFQRTEVSIHVTLIYRHAVLEIDGTSSTPDDPNIICEHFYVISPDEKHDQYFTRHVQNLVSEYLKEINYLVDTMHEFCDGCQSQYKSRHCIGTLVESVAEFGYNKIIRNYFESCHGKGPQDAAGGLLKNQADIAVIRGQFQIRSALELFQFAQSRLTTPRSYACKRRIFKYVEEIPRNRKSFKPIKGIRTIHREETKNLQTVLFRTVSCYCDRCLESDHCLFTDQVGISLEVKVEADDSNLEDKTLEDDSNETVADMINSGNIFAVLCDNEENDFFLLKATSGSHIFDPPIRIRPGDEIRTTCTYSSLSSNETIFFGEGTSDEMCYGFITYYPAQNIALPYCTTWKTVEKCKRYMPQFGGIIDGCKWKDFLSGGNEYIGFMMIELAMHCDTTCSSNCTEKVRNLREHECLRGDLGDFMIFKLQRKYPSISLIKDCFRENKSDNLKAYSYCLILSLAIMYFS
ncbi:unnamed protein product [Mytilus edulis]|uniref:Copper type II ascorbate-dependent monooxygenase C-terminal domain-containing protein n=2 Tax=Mytilus edulis TaxID=6550 RepID=A0A8S3U0S5_MYTED|nr:unnamed protein product [Mytilus edulis]